MGSFSSLGNLVPVLSQATSALNAVTRAGNSFGFMGSSKSDRLKELEAQQALTTKQLQEKQALEESLAQKKLEKDNAMLAADAAQSERRRALALKTAVAKQRASYGGSGLDTGDGGSAEAVLLGLFEQSEADRQDQDTVNTLKKSILDENYASLKASNLLELTQLKDRQKLQRQLL